MFIIFLLLEHLCLLWSFSDHLGFSPSDLSGGVMEWCLTIQRWGAASQDPGGRCSRLPVWSIPTCPAVSPLEKDNHTFPAQQCRETHGKPGQTCPKPLLQRVPGFPEKLEELRGLEMAENKTTTTTQGGAHPICDVSILITAKKTTFLLLNPDQVHQCDAKKPFICSLISSVDVFPCFFLFSGKNSNRKWDSPHPHAESVRLRPLSVRGRK